MRSFDKRLVDAETIKRCCEAFAVSFAAIATRCQLATSRYGVIRSHEAGDEVVLKHEINDALTMLTQVLRQRICG